MKFSETYFSLEFTNQFRKEVNKKPKAERHNSFKTVRQDIESRNFKLNKKFRTFSEAEKLLVEVEKIHPNKFTVTEMCDFSL